MDQLHSRNVVIEKIASLFVEHEGLWKKYASYMNNQSKAFKKLESLLSINEDLGEFLKSKAQQEGFSLEYLLVRPIRRFLEYVSLFEELKKYTSGGHPDYRMTMEANKIFKDALALVDHNKVETIRKLRDIQCTLVFPPKHVKFDLLAAADRHLVSETALKLYEITKKRLLSDGYMFVFNDMLLLTRPRQVQIQTSPSTSVTKHRVAYRVVLNKAFVREPDPVVLEQAKDLPMLEIVQPEVEIVRICFPTREEKLRFKSTIESLLIKNKANISEQEKEDAYKKLAENEAEQLNKLKLTSRIKVPPPVPKRPSASPSKKHISKAHIDKEEDEEEGVPSRRAEIRKLQRELVATKRELKAVLLRLEQMEKQRDHYRKLHDELNEEYERYKRTTESQVGEVEKLKDKAAASSPSDNADTAHLKELLRKEIEQRREAERTNKELRDNFLRLTHLMIQKQTIEGDLLTRLISLENEVIGVDADTRNQEIASQRRELQNVFERAKQELLQTLEESKAALRREVEILVQTVALTLESEKAKGDPNKFTTQLMQENATLKAMNVELDRKIKDYESRTNTAVPATTPRGSTASAVSHSHPQSSVVTKDSPSAPLKKGEDKSSGGLKDSRGKVKKIKTVNYGSDTGERDDGSKRKMPMMVMKLTKKRKDSQTPQPWRTPPTAVNGTANVEIKKVNKVDWNVVKHEQSYWSDDIDSDGWTSAGGTNIMKPMPMSPGRVVNVSAAMNSNAPAPTAPLVAVSSNPHAAEGDEISGEGAAKSNSE
jgi:hypothetical protein